LNARSERINNYALQQPTAFSLYTYTFSEVLDSASLISSIIHFSDHLAGLEIDQLLEAKTQQSLSRSNPSADIQATDPEPILFLQIYAAADYFTLNEALMTNVPPVHVDIILDPYILNVFPRSLVPTALHIVTVAIGAWYLSRLIWSGVANTAHQESSPSQDKKTI
jgi:hypothetical protein